MGYMKILNLYQPQAQNVLSFKRVFAAEKIHGTSARISWKEGLVRLFSGGAKLAHFEGIFDIQALQASFEQIGHATITVYGEAYGGKMQGMKHVYGPDLRFVAFDVKIGDTWLALDDAEDVTSKLGLDFVPYEEGPSDLRWLDAQRDLPSAQTQKLGFPGEHAREGIVIRPTQEFCDNQGNRIMAKHKGDAFRETKRPRRVGENIEEHMEADKAAMEWVTDMRLDHILDGLQAEQRRMMEITDTRVVIQAMTNDVFEECDGECIDSKTTRASFGKRTATLFRAHLAARVHDI